jgi:hypothetical protein
MGGAMPGRADTALLTEANGWQKLTSLPDNLDGYYGSVRKAG